MVANAARASTQAHRLLVVAIKAFPLQAGDGSHEALLGSYRLLLRFYKRSGSVVGLGVLQSRLMIDNIVTYS
jgi:hypothetical protein